MVIYYPSIWKLLQLWCNLRIRHTSAG